MVKRLRMLSPVFRLVKNTEIEKDEIDKMIFNSSP